MKKNPTKTFIGGLVIGLTVGVIIGWSIYALELAHYMGIL